MLEELEEEEEKPDLEIQIPANKVKLMIGPGGTKIGEIQKKSKARVQVREEGVEQGGRQLEGCRRGCGKGEGMVRRAKAWRQGTAACGLLCRLIAEVSTPHEAAPRG